MSERPSTLPLIAPLIAAAWMAVLVVSTWIRRLSYPYDLEWMEGGVLVHAWRIQEGLPIYIEPTPDFIPMLYPPGYHVLLAALGTVFGLSHTLGRLVSIAGTLAAAAALVWASERRLGNVLWGLLAAGCFLAMYPRGGAFYDLVRPDGLLIGLLAWSLVLAAESDPKHLKRAGLLLFLAFTVKQNAASWGFPLVVGIAVRSGLRPALTFAAWAAIPGLVFTVVMQLLTGGLFTVWMLDVPRSHAFVWTRVLPGSIRETGQMFAPLVAFLAVWLISLGPRLAPKVPVPVVTIGSTLAAGMSYLVFSGMPPVAGIEHPAPLEALAAYVLVGVVVVTLALLVVGTVQERRVDGDVVFGLGVALTSWGVCAMMRGHQGGFINVLIPWMWTACALFAIALHDAFHRLPARTAGFVVAVPVLAQLALFYGRLDVERLVPDQADREAGDAVVAWLGEHAEDPVLSPFNPWLAAQAGRTPGFHLIALWDIRHPTGPFREQGQQIMAAVREGYYDVVIDSENAAELGFTKAYERTHTFQSARGIFMPKTGWRARPNLVWERKER